MIPKPRESHDAPQPTKQEGIKIPTIEIKQIKRNHDATAAQWVERAGGAMGSVRHDGERIGDYDEKTI